MGILANSVSICQFMVEGEIPAADLFSWASAQLSRNGFQSIDQGTAELSTGWVHSGNHRSCSFTTPADFWHDHYLAFSLRQDRRRLPAPLLKAHLQVAEEEFLAANAGLRWVPKQKKQELRDTVRMGLLSKTLPVPMVNDAVWDTRSGILTFTALGRPALDAFDSHFRKTFPELRLVAIHPYARAARLVDGPRRSVLASYNRATSEATLDLIQSNRWLGGDFLLWLIYRTINEPSQYRVILPGPAARGESFVAYLNDRLVLCSAGDAGLQKITIAGPQDRFSEVCTALQGGKAISEATLHFERGEQLWKLTLKGDLFSFASFRSPRVKEEKESAVDRGNEQEALFYERMAVLETGLQLFDSLYAAFLTVRLDSAWQGELARIEAWLAAS